MDSFRKRVKHEGATLRERILTRDRRMINRYAPDNPSYKEVFINGESINLIINSTENQDRKSFATMPGEHIDRGTILEWNGYWMVISTDYDEELYQKGIIKKCNYVLKWINEKREIIERNCIVTYPYYSSLDTDKLLSVNTTRSMVDIPFDEETKKIRMGDRFFISRNEDHPVPYSVENVNDVAEVFNGFGYITLGLRQTQLDVDEDNTDLFICNYKAKEEDTISDNRYCAIKATPSYLIVGYKGITLSPLFYSDGVLVNDVVPKWTINCDFLSSLTINQSELDYVISTDENNLLGRSFTVSLIDENEEYLSDEVLITIRGF